MVNSNSVTCPAKALSFRVRGPLSIENERGQSVEIKGAKEKALLILLAFSPMHERTRSWLADKLWSDRFEEQARTSLRQVLKNLRKSLGPDHEQYLCADRARVRLVCKINLIDPEPMRASCELLEDIDVRDPEFECWIRDLRLGESAAPEPKTDSRVQAPGTRLRHSAVGLCLTGQGMTREEELIATTLVDAIAEQLQSTGTMAAQILSPNHKSPEHADLDAFIEIQCLAKDGDWFANVRVTPRKRHFYAWSGRFRIPMRFQAVWGSAELSAFANKVTLGVVKTLSQTTPQASFLVLNRAISMLFSGNAKRISEADVLLEDIVSQVGSAAALAWRSYARLTNALEFGDFSETATDEADLLIREALEKEPNSALIQGLASIVQTKLVGDFDYGHHLAERAISEDDRNAYALDAFSQALFFRGEHEKAHHIAEWARKAAQYSPNAFNWDMRSALSALSLGRVSEARQLAYQSHVKAPHYRPALRYLCCLSALEDDLEKSTKYANMLAQLEPGFQQAHLMDEAYPVQTLRWLGLHENLPFRN